MYITNMSRMVVCAEAVCVLQVGDGAEDHPGAAPHRGRPLTGPGQEVRAGEEGTREGGRATGEKFTACSLMHYSLVLSRCMNTAPASNL